MVDVLQLSTEIQKRLAHCVEDLTTAGRLCTLQVLLAQRIVQLVAARRSCVGELLPPDAHGCVDPMGEGAYGL